MEVPFTTEMVDLDVPGYKERLLEISPAGTVRKAIRVSPSNRVGPYASGASTASAASRE